MQPLPYTSTRWRKAEKNLQKQDLVS